ncbi:MAG: M28 family peptidase [Pseudomonadota bacterium]
MMDTPAVKLVGLILLLIIAYVFRSVLAQPPAVDTAHPFQTDRAFERLERILGDETPHPVDTDANDAVRDRLITEIEALGFDPFLKDKFHCRSFSRQARCMRLQNIGFWVTEPGPNAVMIASHYDSVPAGPGASDDGAGYASSLEIAAVLKDRAFPRPLFVLITDGEETGLMGAHMFAHEDPLAQQIGAVVNMEARGVRGLASVIQTSRPNGRDIAALISETRLPVSNSLNADIYELLPNDTDMTEFLTLPIDAANLAYAGGVSFYHTPGDNLENMDKRALFNLGANALSITEAFLNGGDIADEPEEQLLYADIVGRILLVIPVWLGRVFLALGVLAPLALLVLRHSRPNAIRATAAPLLALILGLVLAIASTMLVGAIRAEQLFGSAYPIGLRGLHGAAMVFGCVIPYVLIARGVPKAALYASGWFWFSAFGGLAFLVVAGSASSFAFTSLLFAGASLLFLMDRQKSAEIVAGIGFVVFVTITFPTTAVGETGLLIEASAPFAFVLGAAFVTLVPVIWPEDGVTETRDQRVVLAVPGVLVALFFTGSMLVPGYTPDAPRGFNILHIQDEVSNGAPVWSLPANEPLPDTMAQIADFERHARRGGARETFIAPAPRLDHALHITLESDVSTPNVRRIAVQIDAPDANDTRISWPSEINPVEARVNGEDIDLTDTVLQSVGCFGRSCRTISLELTFPAGTNFPGVNVSSYTYGLPPSADFLTAARPENTMPVHYGDSQLLRTRFAVDGFEAANE